MSVLATNAITDASGGNTTTINGLTPTVSNMAGRNLIINGAMQVAQRGTSTSGVTTTDGYYACDRWRTQTDYGTWTISQDTDAPNGFSNSMKLLCTSGGTSNSNEISLHYYFEGQDVQGLAYGTSDAKEITASFWIKSNTTGTYTLRFYIEDTNRPEVSKTFTIDTADTWEYKTVTVPANTSYSVTNDNTFGFGLLWYFGAASSFTSAPLNETWNTSVSANSVNSDIPGLGGSTNDYVQITGVQLEAGSVATPFEHRQYGQELALCQRYYEIIGRAIGTAGYADIWSQPLNGFTNFWTDVRFKVEKRAPNYSFGLFPTWDWSGAAPSIRTASTSALVFNAANFNYLFSSPALNNNEPAAFVSSEL